MSEVEEGRERDVDDSTSLKHFSLMWLSVQNYVYRELVHSSIKCTLKILSHS